MSDTTESGHDHSQPNPPPQPPARQEHTARRILVDPEAEAQPASVTLVMHKRERSHWPWALVAVVLILATAIVAPVLYWSYLAQRGVTSVAQDAKDLATHTIDAVTTALTPTQIRHEVINVVSEQARPAAKLVVLEQPVRVWIDKSDEYRLLWDTLYLGQNTARLQIENNRVQWVVDLQGFGEDDVTVDEATKTVTLRFPPPRLDESMVVVQTDPRFISVETGRGWARWPGSAEQLAEDAKREIRPTIIEAVSTPENRDTATTAAQAALEKVFRPALTPIEQQGYTVRVEITEAEAGKTIATQP